MLLPLQGPLPSVSVFILLLALSICMLLMPLSNTVTATTAACFELQRVMQHGGRHCCVYECLHLSSSHVHCIQQPCFQVVVHGRDDQLYITLLLASWLGVV